MLAEIIAIGDELTSGQRLDTNSQWISQQLSDLGVTTIRHQTIADYLTPMVEAFQSAVQRVDVVIVTGGLGPTADDLTRNALAHAFDAELQFDPASWEHIAQLFRKRNYALPESNRVQAMFPEGARVIPNASGTAPGIDWERPSTIDQSDPDQPIKAKPTCRFFCLPGVPAEMKEMFSDYVLPQIQTWQGDQRSYIARKVIRTFGAGESHVESMLPDLIQRGNDPQVGITASKATISLRIEARGASLEECQAKIAPVESIIRQTLGDLVFGEGEQELEDAVAPLLRDSGHRLVVVEWGTAGTVSQALSKSLNSSPGPSPLAGSVILGHQQAAADWLAPDIQKTPADSMYQSQQELQSWTEALAKIAAQRFQASLAIASGPLPTAGDADSATNPVAFQISAAVLGKGQQKWHHRNFHVVGHQSIWQPRASKQVLNLLRMILLGKADAS